MIKSGFFSSVTVEEQTPSPDRQKMAVRIAAQWKPAGARPLVKAEPLPAGFSPGGPGMPFPDMGGGGPVAFFPGSGMPGMPPSMSMPRGAPEGAMLRGPDGAPVARKSEKSKGPSGVLRIGPGGEVLTNSTDSVKPSAEEDAKDNKKSKDAGEQKDSKDSPE